jgi:outer membrane lipoprotein LolB
MRFISRGVALSAAALLAACAAHPLTRVPGAGTGFELAGRMSVRAEARVFSSALRWKQDAGGDEIWLNTPLGQTVAHLQDGRDGATLTTAEHRQYRAQSIESLTHTALGWRFPLAGLRHWVLGQPVPGIAQSAPVRDAAGRLAAFTQADWRVSYDYADAAATRPSRLDLSGPDAQIRLVIDRLDVVQP